jgi:hypothetical protein
MIGCRFMNDQEREYWLARTSPEFHARILAERDAEKKTRFMAMRLEAQRKRDKELEAKFLSDPAFQPERDAMREMRDSQGRSQAKAAREGRLDRILEPIWTVLLWPAAVAAPFVLLYGLVRFVKWAWSN